MRQRLQLLGAAAILVFASFAAGLYLSRPVESAALHSPQPGQAAVEKLLTTSFSDAAGHPTKLSQLRDKPLIVNFWATWCPPCLKEMPLFSRLQKRHPNVRFVGIAADTPENVRTFLAEHKLSYLILTAADGAMSLMAELGNNGNGLPYTLAIDASGHVRHTKLGAMSEADTEGIIAELADK